MSCTKLFVYGTLQSDSLHPLAREAVRLATDIERASVRGRLYLIDYYPGLIVDDTAGWVTGEVFSFTAETMPSLLASLDRYEECDAQSPLPHEYRRLICPVRINERNLFANAWLYEYTRHDVQKYKQIHAFTNRS